MKYLFTQISSGKLKGRKLFLPSFSTTRSTKSIVKGSFFDSLRYDLRGKIFIEAFGGSALMAAEAISNGVDLAYAIEIDKNAYKIALQNAKSIGENLKILNADTFKITPEIVKNLKKQAILYIDPPFDIRDGFEDVYQKCYEMIKIIDNDKIFIIAIEHISSLKPLDNIGNYNLIKTKKFGNTSLSYYR